MGYLKRTVFVATAAMCLGVSASASNGASGIISSEELTAHLNMAARNAELQQAKKGSPDKSVGLGIKFSESEKKEPNIRHSS